MFKVRRTERGWAGHFICANLCAFRRNTLLEFGNIKIVVSTVGAKEHRSGDGTSAVIGHNRYYETMAFYSNPEDKIYNDIDPEKQIGFASNWAIDRISERSDLEANNMHEEVVNEITTKLLNGFEFKIY